MSNVTIKVEGNQESVTEIQTYLEKFNEEIEGGTGEQLQHVQCKCLIINSLLLKLKTNNKNYF